MSRPKEATTSPRRRPLVSRPAFGEGDRVEVEHEVRDDRSGARARDLGGDVGAQLTGGEPTEDPVRERDDRVEVGAGHRAEREDQRDEPGGGRGRVLEQLQPEVVGGQAGGEDPGPDDDGDEQPGAERLGGDLPAQRWWSSVQQHGRRRSPPAGAASARSRIVRPISARGSRRSR